ncbi:hypothetical protein AB751O23_AI_00060 [Chlamydiales bacterium SCGC AB-751-O23]|nr:hypothetical protein AB751O23_AI_00060 [Chlamydiales bacterium SCGC AB-751-O23]
MHSPFEIWWHIIKLMSLPNYAFFFQADTFS